MNVAEARSEIKTLERKFSKGGIPRTADERPLTLDEIKLMHQNKQGRNQVHFHIEDYAKFIDTELLRTDGGGSLITRRVLKMADQSVTAAEILEQSTKVVEDQLTKFERVADAAIEETKKRVSQLTDYNNRLTTAMSNLNKTLGDEKMVRALENADRIAKALLLLDELEKKGSLKKIMDALK